MHTDWNEPASALQQMELKNWLAAFETVRKFRFQSMNKEKELFWHIDHMLICFGDVNCCDPKSKLENTHLRTTTQASGRGWNTSR